MTITITKKTASVLSNDNLMKKAVALTKESPPAEYLGLLHELAKSSLNRIQIDQVLDAIRKGLGCAMKAIRAEYKDIKNKLLVANDLGFKVAKEVLKERYGDGLFLKRAADGSYYLYDLTHFRRTSSDVVRGNIQKIASKYLTEGNITLAALVSNAMQCLDALLASDHDLLGMTDVPPAIINCQNNEVWIGKDGSVELKLHHPTSRLFACLEYKYDPDATCPIFDKTMLEIFDKSSDPQGMVSHFEEILGYTISGQRHIAMFVLLIGHGRNGKSKLMETCQRLIGEHAVLCDSLATFQKDRFNMAALHGKLLFCDDDLNYGITLNDGMIKKISESKLISARHPYGKQKFTFRNLAMPMIASNDYPNTDDISPGMIRRACIIPFDRQFTPEEDNKGLFPAIWEDEMSGILNRAFHGLQRLLKRGGFLEPDDCVKARKEFLAHANPLYAFLSDFTVKDSEAKMKVKDFKDAFVHWAKGQGIPINKSDKGLLRKLRGLQNEFGYTVTKDASKVAYPFIYGLSLSTEKLIAENVS